METILPSLTWVILDVVTTIRFFFLKSMCTKVFCLHANMCNLRMSGASRAQKRTLDPLGVELMNSC